MAILDFFNKKDNEIQKEEVVALQETQDYTPKSMPKRGAGGKFVSKKKLEIKKDEPIKGKVHGPIMAPFAGKEIRKFYANKRWYFAIQDLIFLLASDPPFPSLSQLKEKKEFKEFFDKNIVVFKEEDLSENTSPNESKNYINVDCADSEGSMEILREIIRFYKASFPGSLLRWIEDISTHEFIEIKNEEK